METTNKITEQKEQATIFSAQQLREHFCTEGLWGTVLPKWFFYGVARKDINDTHVNVFMNQQLMQSNIKHVATLLENYSKTLVYFWIQLAVFLLAVLGAVVLGPGSAWFIICIVVAIVVFNTLYSTFSYVRISKKLKTLYCLIYPQRSHNKYRGAELLTGSNWEKFCFLVVAKYITHSGYREFIHRIRQEQQEQQEQKKNIKHKT